jgi:transposase
MARRHLLAWLPSSDRPLFAADGMRTGDKPRTSCARDGNRSVLPVHLKRIEHVIDVENKAFACCGSTLHVIGEAVAKRLDVVSATFRVLVTGRPRYGCRACEAAQVQAPAAARIVLGVLSTEVPIAHVLVAKYADHFTLHRQARSILARASRLIGAPWRSWSALSFGG